jgi:hypothetical protein
MPEMARKKSIIVYQNEPIEKFIVEMSGTIKYFIKENLFEYGAWVAVKKILTETVLSLNGSDWFLMLHDSCAFEPDTWENINELIKIINYTKIEFYSLAYNGFHNICLVRKHGIFKVADHLEGKQTMTKAEACDLEGPRLFDVLDPKVPRGEYGAGTEECGRIRFSTGEKVIVRLKAINLLKFYKAIERP